MLLILKGAFTLLAHKECDEMETVSSLLVKIKKKIVFMANSE